MKNLAYALSLASAVFTMGIASATTYQDYQIKGSSCISTTNGISAQVSQFGDNANGTAINVSCPLVVPSHAYTYAYILVDGYNRSSTDHLSCQISGTDYTGNNLVAQTASLPSNSAYFQANSTFINPSTSLGNYNLALTCHIPAQTASGLSHLTAISLTLGY